MINRVRIAVLAFNAGNDLERCVDALLALETRREIEVMVIDNASTDDAVDRLVASGRPVTIDRVGRNLGFPANNRAFPGARDETFPADAVALVNPDATVTPGWLDPLADALDADDGLGATCPKILLDGPFHDVDLPADTAAGVDGERWVIEVGDQHGEPVPFHVVGPRFGRGHHRNRMHWRVWPAVTIRVDTPDPVVIDLCAPFGEPQSVTVVPNPDAREVLHNVGAGIADDAAGTNRGYHEVDLGQYDQPVEVPAWMGAGVLLRTEYLRDVGGFDPRWFLYGEDTDLSWRGRRAGWRYLTVPSAVQRHRQSATVGHGSELYDVLQERNRLLNAAVNATPAAAASVWASTGVRLARSAASDVRRKLQGHEVDATATSRLARAVVGAVGTLP